MISLLKYLKVGTFEQVSVATGANVDFGDKVSSKQLFSRGSKKPQNFIIR